MRDRLGRPVRERRDRLGRRAAGGTLTSHHALPGRLDWLALGARPASRRCRTQWRRATCGEQCSASFGGATYRTFRFFVKIFSYSTGHATLSLYGPPAKIQPRETPLLVLAGWTALVDRSADLNSMWSSLELAGPHFTSVDLYLTSMSSISKMSVEPPGILGGEPRSPYAI